MNSRTEDTKTINNFNLGYECLDERDDYYTTSKQSNMDQYKLSTFNQVDYEDDCNFGINSNVEEDYEDPNILSLTATKKLHK
ncbi:hypothetical protein BYT27DRAFT_7117628 [Phlegmacium glaucopus]|nr:hypothetical protein BYT27DRAFT_7117628 [Phlegmacium glaucopus]